MASHLSIPHHPRTSPDGTQSSWNGGIPFRTRRRVTFLLLAAAFASIVFYSQKPLGEKYPQACQSLDPQITCVPELQVNSPPLTVTITRTAPSTTETVVVEPPVQPVVFALVMYSESSAKEGAVLLKVSHLAFIIAALCNKASFSVRYHVHFTTPPFPYCLRRSRADVPGDSITPSHTPAT